MRITLDYPPVWLAGVAGLGWLASRALTPGPAILVAPGRLLIAAGLGLMLAAAWQMWRHHTTVDPHGLPRDLVTGGVFRVSRNPIYLGDALVLAGLCFTWRVPLGALFLTPVFIELITRRFIRREEAMLALLFPDAFAHYRRRTRRWF